MAGHVRRHLVVYSRIVDRVVDRPQVPTSRTLKFRARDNERDTGFHRARQAKRLGAAVLSPCYQYNDVWDVAASALFTGLAGPG